MEGKKLSRQRLWQLKQMAAGNCQQCGRSAGGRHTLCAPCIAKMAARQKLTAKNRHARGLCYNCPRNAVVGRVKCEYHLNCQRRYQRYYRAMGR